MTAALSAVKMQQNRVVDKSSGTYKEVVYKEVHTQNKDIAHPLLGEVFRVESAAVKQSKAKQSKAKQSKALPILSRVESVSDEEIGH